MPDFDILADFSLEMTDYLRCLDQDLTELAQCSADVGRWSRFRRTLQQIESACQFLGFSRLARIAQVAAHHVRPVREGVPPRTPELVSQSRETVAALRTEWTRLEARSSESLELVAESDLC